MHHSRVVIGSLLVVLAAACSDASGEAATTSAAAPGSTTTTVAAATSTTTTAPTATATTLSEATTTSIVATPVVTDVIREERGQDPAYTLLITIPAVSGLSDPAAEATINNELAAVGNDAAGGFLTDIEDADNYGFGNDLVVGYETRALHPTVASFRFNHYVYFDGAAHGMSAISTLTFDLTTGRILTLPDVLIGDSAPTALSILAAAHLRDDYYSGDPAEFAAWVPETGTLDVSRFALGPAGLEISFDQYEVGPGAMGPVTVTVPYEELGVLINQEGPIPVIRG